MDGDLLPKKAELRAPVQRRFINGYFKKYLGRLNSENIRFIGILGNDDLEIVEPDYLNIISNFENIYNIDGKKIDIEGISFIGLSNVLDTPFFRKDRIVIENNQEMPEQLKEFVYINKCHDPLTVEEWKEYRKASVPKMENILEDLPKPTEGYKGIYIFHDPPYGIGLDNCKNGEKVGSKAMAEFLRNSNAYMSFHGHIHESPKMSGNWYGKLGNTICIQPGQSEYKSTELHYVFVDTDENKYEFKIVKINEDEIVNRIFE